MSGGGYPHGPAADWKKPGSPFVAEDDELENDACRECGHLDCKCEPCRECGELEADCTCPLRDGE